MFVRCPHCTALVAVANDGAGIARDCPFCHRPLQAADPGPPEAATPEGTHAERSPAQAVAGDAGDRVAAAPTAADGVSAAPAAATTRPALRAPSFAHATTAAARRRYWLAVAAIAGLSLLLALQLLLADRARLARDPGWRPALLALCGILRCSVPPWREPAAFRILARDVRATRPGVLGVRATIRNDARWPQPWPRLRLSLADADGRTIAAREFAPREYRGDGKRAPVIGSGQSVAFAFEAIDPGPGIVAFSFDFE